MEQFRLVGTEEQQVKPAQTGDGGAALRMLMLALTALSQRTIVALANCFTFGCVASVWFLVNSILPNPTPTQLYGVCGYAVFILILEVVRRK